MYTVALVSVATEPVALVAPPTVADEYDAEPDDDKNDAVDEDIDDDDTLLWVMYTVVLATEPLAPPALDAENEYGRVDEDDLDVDNDGADDDDDTVLWLM